MSSQDAGIPTVGNEEDGVQIVEEKTDEQVDQEIIDSVAGIDFSKVEARHFVFEDNIKTDDEGNPDQELVQEAYMGQEKIIVVLKQAQHLILELGKRLIPFRDERKYRYLGYDTFQEWYQSIGLSKTTAYRAMNIYETFVLKFEMPEEEVYSKDIRKLDYLLPLKNKVDPETKKPILTKESAGEWLGKADLSESDLIYEINEAKGFKSTSDQIEEKNELIIKGTFVLVPTEEDTGKLKRVIDKKLPIEVYQNDDEDIVVKVY